jgi:hypothetical protein
VTERGVNVIRSRPSGDNLGAETEFFANVHKSFSLCAGDWSNILWYQPVQGPGLGHRR